MGDSDSKDNEKPKIGCSKCQVWRFGSVLEAASHFESKMHSLEKIRKKYVVRIDSSPEILSTASVLEHFVMSWGSQLTVVGFVRLKSNSKCCVLFLLDQPAETSLDVLNGLSSGKKLALKTASGATVRARMRLVAGPSMGTPDPLKEEVLSWLGTVQSQDRLSEQVAGLKSRVLVDRRDAELRDGLSRDLLGILSSSLAVSDVRTFGSSINGLGFKGCDVDVLVEMEGSDAKEKVRKVSALLRRHWREFTRVVAISKARVPIVTCVHVRTQLSCDVSFGNPMSVFNSHFIRGLFESHPAPLHDLAVVVRFWARVHGLPPGISQYALVMMVIFYFQNRCRVPSVRRLQEDLPGEDSRQVDGWECGCRVRLEAEPPSEPDSFGPMLGGFFKFYSDFDYEAFVVSPYAGEPLPKAGFSNRAEDDDDESFRKYLTVVGDGAPQLDAAKPMVVQDPFEQNRNVSGTVSQNCVKNWVRLCAASGEVMAAGSESLTDVLQPLKVERPAKKRNNRGKRKRLEKEQQLSGKSKRQESEATGSNHNQERKGSGNQKETSHRRRENPTKSGGKK